MPLFDFSCDDCGLVEERLVAHNEKHRCSKCGGKTTKLIGKPAGFIFRGSGFFATDYGKNQAVADKHFGEGNDHTPDLA